MFLHVLLAIITLMTSFASLTSAEETSVAYDYAVGGAPTIARTNDGSILGLALDLEVTSSGDCFPVLRISGLSTQRTKKKTDSTSLRSSNVIDLEPGIRYYFQPFEDSWTISGLASFARDDETYRLANGDHLKRTSVEAAFHPVGGYRWIWSSKLYVLVGTGLSIPVYGRYEDVETGKRDAKSFWGPWSLKAMSSVGMVF